MARLRPQTEKQKAVEQLKPIPTEIDSRIAITLITMQNNADAHSTVKTAEYALRWLAQNANLLDPEDVKHYVSIAKTKKTKKPVTAETKNK